MKMPDKNKRRRKKDSKYPGLTDIKKKQNTVTRRLEKKVFKKCVIEEYKIFNQTVMYRVLIIIGNKLIYVCFRETVKKIAASLDKFDHRRFRDKFGDQFNYIHDTA